MQSPAKYYNFFNNFVELSIFIVITKIKKTMIKNNNKNKKNTWFHNCANIYKVVLALPLFFLSLKLSLRG